MHNMMSQRTQVKTFANMLPSSATFNSRSPSTMPSLTLPTPESGIATAQKHCATKAHVQV